MNKLEKEIFKVMTDVSVQKDWFKAIAKALARHFKDCYPAKVKK